MNIRGYKMKNKIILSLLLSVFVLFLTSCFSLASFSASNRIMSVEDFEKSFISSLEKHIASKDYFEYLDTYDFIRRGLGPMWGNDEKTRIEYKNRDTAARNVTQIQKYRDYYILASKYEEFAKLLTYTNIENSSIYSSSWRDYIEKYNHIKKLSETDFSYVGKAAKELLKDTKYETAYNKYTTYIKDMHLANIGEIYVNLEMCIVKDNLYGYLGKYNELIAEIKAAGMEINSIDEKYQSYHRDCVNHFLNKINIDYFKFKLNKKKQEYVLEYYSLSKDKYSDAKYHPIMGEILVVPAMYNNLPVTEIAKKAEYYSTNIKLVVLPDTIKKVNDEALRNKQIAILPKDVNIADVLFEKEKLSFKLPKSLDSIGSYAFSGSKFDEIHLNFESIGKGAFSYCKFKNIIISKLVPEVLLNCMMENVVIKDSVQNIVKHAFKDCSISGNLVLPKSVKIIEPFAFENCSISGNLVLPNSINTIVNNCFASCSISGNFTLPNSITTIGEKAFYDSTISNGIIISDSVKIIGHAAFFKSKIPSIVFSGENTKFEGSYTFAGNESLKSITLPKNIKYIPEGFFRDCSELSEIKNLPDSGKIQFGENAFTGCKSLPKTVRDKLISLGYKDGFFKLDSKYMP